jgi:hypothetical protein
LRNNKIICNDIEVEDEVEGDSSNNNTMVLEEAGEE